MIKGLQSESAILYEGNEGTGVVDVTAFCHKGTIRQVGRATPGAAS